MSVENDKNDSDTSGTTSTTSTTSTIGKECPNCHTIHYRPGPRIKYCSKKCERRFNAKYKAKACEYCGIIHRKGTKYCSRTCFGLAFSAAKTAEKVYNESLGIIPVKNVIPVSPQAREYREKECPVCHIIHKGRGDHCSRACSVIGSARTHERNGSYQKRGEAVTKTRSESLEMPYRDARLGTNLEFLAAEDYSVAIPNFPEIPDGYMLNEFE